MSRGFSGQRLERLRGKTTQTDLAHALRKHGFGTTQTTVSRWESGQVPHSSVLPALASELGVTVEQLFDDDDAEAAQMAPAAAGSLLNLEAIDALLMERIGVAVEKALADAKARQ